MFLGSAAGLWLVRAETLCSSRPASVGVLGKADLGGTGRDQGKGEESSSSLASSGLPWWRLHSLQQLKAELNTVLLCVDEGR